MEGIYFLRGLYIFKTKSSCITLPWLKNSKFLVARHFGDGHMMVTVVWAWEVAWGGGVRAHSPSFLSSCPSLSFCLKKRGCLAPPPQGSCPGDRWWSVSQSCVTCGRFCRCWLSSGRRQFRRHSLFTVCFENICQSFKNRLPWPTMVAPPDQPSQE